MFFLCGPIRVWVVCPPPRNLLAEAEAVRAMAAVVVRAPHAAAAPLPPPPPPPPHNFLVMGRGGPHAEAPSSTRGILFPYSVGLCLSGYITGMSILRTCTTVSSNPS